MGSNPVGITNAKLSVKESFFCALVTQGLWTQVQILFRKARAIALANCTSDKFVVIAGFIAFQQTAVKQQL